MSIRKVDLKPMLIGLPAYWQTSVSSADVEKSMSCAEMTINYLRDESCHKRILESLYEQAIDFDNSTKNTILANDLGEHMKHAVKLLSNRQREVFELSRHHMLTNKEIAEQLNISISTVQDHLSASLKIIRTYFKKEGLLHTSQIIFFQIN